VPAIKRRIKPEETTGNAADGNLASSSEATQSSAPPASTSQTENPEAYYPPAGGADEQPVEASEAPPPLPEYTQPPSPGDDYIWTPGYWAWSNGFYWVPGAWIVAPWVGALWTPPWWGYQNGVYVWHAGYWAPHIGFYGGIDYGFGYTGRGYYGAYWNQGRVYYNRAVTDVNISVVHNVYERPVPRVPVSRISYNGGRGGIEARPIPQELAVSRDPRLAAVPAQVQARPASGRKSRSIRRRE
jgi:WXXGXW repeat (2 copies)